MKRTVLCIYCSNNGKPGVHVGEHLHEHTAREIAISKAQTCKENYFKALNADAMQTAREVAR